jgi:hypothetical protein
MVEIKINNKINSHVFESLEFLEISQIHKLLKL